MKLPWPEWSYHCIVYNGVIEPDARFLAHLDTIQKSNDPLSANYNIRHLARMKEYGYIWDEKRQLIPYMTGLEDFGEQMFRIESRTYIHEAYRRRIWKCPDEYVISRYFLDEYSSEASFLFKSREAKNPAGFLISQRLTSIYDDWVVYPREVELKYPNNWQWIMHGPTEDAERYVEKIRYL